MRRALLGGPVAAVFTRASLLSTVVALAFVGVTAGVGAAYALPVPAPAITLSGTAPATAVGTTNALGSVTFSYAVSTPDDLTGVTLQTNQDALLPAQASSVMVDGVAAPTGTVTQPSSKDIAVSIAALTAGNHTIAFRATVPGTAGLTSSTATLSFTDAAAPGATPITSAAVPIAVNEPDLALTTTAYSGVFADSQVPATLRLGTLSEGMIQADVTNHGQGAASATLLMDLPAGAVYADSFALGDTPITCTPSTADPHQVSCPLGVIAANQTTSVLLLLSTETAPPVGTSGTATITAQVDDATLTDTNPTNNVADTSIAFIGAAHLTYTVTPTATKAMIGKAVTLTLTVRNDGPQPAPNAIALVLTENNNFAITSFDGKPLTIPSGSGNPTSPGTMPLGQASRTRTASALQRAAASTATGPRRAVLTQLAASGAHGLASPPPATGMPPATSSSGSASGSATSGNPGDGRLWDLGTLAVGQSVTAHLTLTAKSAGAMQLMLLGASDAGDPNCSTATSEQQAINAGCLRLLSLTAVPVPPHPSSGGAHSVLANTGAPSSVPTAIGIAMVLLGGLALRLGRRRS